MLHKCRPQQTDLPVGGPRQGSYLGDALSVGKYGLEVCELHQASLQLLIVSASINRRRLRLLAERCRDAS